MFKKFAMFVLMIGMLFSFGLVQQTTVSADSAVTVSENTTENNTETMSVPIGVQCSGCNKAACCYEDTSKNKAGKENNR